MGMTAGPFYEEQALKDFIESDTYTIIPIGRKDERLAIDGTPKGRNVQDGNRLATPATFTHTPMPRVNWAASRTSATPWRAADSCRYRLAR